MGKRIFAVWGVSIGALVTLVAFQNCANPNANFDLRAKMGTSGTADEIFGQGDPTDDGGNPTNIVCDPFATTEKTTPGLKGSLYVYEKSDAEDKIKKLNDIFTRGQKIQDTAIYFSKLNVPTRRWETGFENQSGQKLENSKGEVLIEWFGLKFETLIKLNDDDKEGYYQFATISDDGSVVEVDPGDGFKRVVDNDGLTETRMKCGNYVYIKKGDRLPARIAYFQGPRVEIALNLMWRKIDPKKTNLQSKHCGSAAGFFSNGKDTNKMKEVKAAGWKMMETSNFELKEKVAVDCSK